MPLNLYLQDPTQATPHILLLPQEPTYLKALVRPRPPFLADVHSQGRQCRRLRAICIQAY